MMNFMNIHAFVWIILGGGLGALSRYLLVLSIHSVIKTVFPLGILCVNCSGAFLMGFFMAFVMARLFELESMRLLVAIGFLGGYTTFSSFAWETWILYASGEWMLVFWNVLLTNLIGLFMLCAGFFIARTML